MSTRWIFGFTDMNHSTQESAGCDDKIFSVNFFAILRYDALNAIVLVHLYVLYTGDIKKVTSFPQV
jgi:hypothetical protein